MRTKNIYIKVVITVIGYCLTVIGPSLTVIGCTSDLDQVPLAETTMTADKALAEQGSYDKYMAKLYSALAISGKDGPAAGDIVGADQGEATFVRSYFNLQELPTDEAAISWSDDGINGLNYVNWNSTNRFVNLVYNRLELINAWCNEFLIQTTDDKVAGRNNGTSADEVHQMRNETRLIRAFCYNVLMDLYANVPFVDENTGVGAYLPEQKGRDFLFPYIESEVKDAMNGLPEKSSQHYAMMNRYVADMILAHMYMNAEVYGQGNHYNDAITYLNDIIDNGGYRLEDNYQHNFCADNDLSSEIIFPLVYDCDYAQSYGGTTYIMAATFGTDMSYAADYGLNAAWGGLRIKEDAVNLFQEGDRRAMFYTTERTKEITNMGDYKQGYDVLKYTNLKRDGSQVANLNFASTDFPFYRLADAYLLYVEAVKRGGSGDAAKAVTLWNAIQQRAFGNSSHNIASLNDISLNDILDERGRELYWEGHRRTDLIRFNAYVDNKNWSWKGGSQAGVMKIDNKYKVFPIPSTDLSANTNLKQNEGY